MSSTAGDVSGMRVRTCARYPVKSLGGEQLDVLRLDVEGVSGDRRWALLNAAGRIGAARRTPRYVRLPHVLDMSARTTGDHAEVTLPDGAVLSTADPRLPAALTAVVGEPVTLAPADRYLDAEPLHVVTTASVRWWAAQVPHERADWRRLRPNLLVDAPGDDRVEDAWVGRRLRVGTVGLRVVDQTERCRMPAEDQLGLGRAPGLLRALARRGLMLGVYARVMVPGEIRPGDPVTLD